jgi:regulatory protein
VTAADGRARAGCITRLVADAHARGWVNVFLDERFAFRLTVATAAQLRLDTDLTEADAARLLDNDGLARVTDSALRFLASRPHSQRELTRHLAGKGYTEVQVDHARRRLVDLGLIDDLEFARWWVSNRLTHRPRGQTALRHELLERGVERSVVEAALEGVDEVDPATRLAVAQADRHRHLDRHEFNQRIGSFLQRRGFQFDAIRRALDCAWEAVRESA